MIGPVKDGVWQITVTTDSGPQVVYYRVQCQAGGGIVIDDGTIDQSFDYPPAQPGWTASTLNFGDSCEVINSVTWCVYYNFTTLAPTAMSGNVMVVGDGTPITFPAAATWLNP